MLNDEDLKKVDHVDVGVGGKMSYNDETPIEIKNEVLKRSYDILKNFLMFLVVAKKPEGFDKKMTKADILDSYFQTLMAIHNILANHGIDGTEVEQCFSRITKEGKAKLEEKSQPPLPPPKKQNIH